MDVYFSEGSGPDDYGYSDEQIRRWWETEYNTPVVLEAIVPKPELSWEVVKCVSMGMHLLSCDSDGYCNYCGEQGNAEAMEELRKPFEIPVLEHSVMSFNLDGLHCILGDILTVCEDAEPFVPTFRNRIEWKVRELRWRVVEAFDMLRGRHDCGDDW